jgi:hypothetical protein
MGFLDELKDKAEEFGESAKEAFEAAKDKASELVEDVKDKFDGDDSPAEQDAGTAAAAPEQTYDVADDSLGEGAAATETDTLGEGATTTSDTLGEGTATTDTFGDTGPTTRETLGETAPTTTETLSETAGGAADLGDGYADADAMTEAADAAGDDTADLTEALQNRSEEARFTDS